MMDSGKATQAARSLLLTLSKIGFHGMRDRCYVVCVIRLQTPIADELILGRKLRMKGFKRPASSSIGLPLSSR